MKLNFDIYEYVFPLYGGKIGKNSFEPIVLCGTASRIADNLFITAAHSIKYAKTYEACAIGILNYTTKQYTYFNFSIYESHDGLDLGIIEIYIKRGGEEIAKMFYLSKNPLNLLDDVFTIGFPHGLDLKNNVLIKRALKGYVVNHFSFRDFPKAPKVYELSFQCPVGISGAPLLKMDYGSITVHGYIIGNSKTEIEIFSEKEELQENNTTTIVTRSETTKFGIAIDSKELEKINSQFISF